MTILTLGKVVIDTDLDHESHKVEIQKHTSFFCERRKPVQWFTQTVDNEYRYIHLHYTDDGSKLIKVTSWDKRKPHEAVMRTVKKLKNKSNDDCYFSMNKQDEEYEYVQEVDNMKISKNQMTWWERDVTFWGKYK